MNRRTFYVTAAAGAYVAGRRVEILSPGPSGAVELTLTAEEAAHDLRTGALSEFPPAGTAKIAPLAAEEAAPARSGPPEVEKAPDAAENEKTTLPKGPGNGRRRR